MTISETIVPQFDHEMGITRICLERVPEDKFSWKPHEKSMDFVTLAAHIAEMASWATTTVTTDELNFDLETYQPYVPQTNQELLAKFDGNVATARAALAGCSDDEFRKPWALKAGGQTIFSMPKISTIRGMVISHIIHHRGQLSVYLRLNDIPVPSIYGPSADDSGGM